MQSGIEFLDRARAHGERTALKTPEGTLSYHALADRSEQVARTLLAGRQDLQEERIAFLIPPGVEYVLTQWGIWKAGGIAIPMCVQHPTPELEHVLDDSGAQTIVVHSSFRDRLAAAAEKRGLRLLDSSELTQSRDTEGELPRLEESRRALMIYTSGTTGKPKGVVTTHHNIRAQINSLIEAWEWSNDDRILLVLPLHHTHGVLNVLCCCLWAGAACHIPGKTDAETVWNAFHQGDLTLFMAVPTIYARLIQAWDAADPDQRQQWSQACANLRLMVCGSAALPVPTLNKWKEVSGHTLLERYGMTEIGMALSNSLHGERLPGFVGYPLPGVEVRLADESGKAIDGNGPGEIQIRGDNVFLEYWGRPEATAKSFRDGWFLTGDTAVVENGAYRILGRNSVDIIKTGGFKVSALEIEQTLLDHPLIEECAVVGVEDAEWGERVCAAVKTCNGQALELADLRVWCKERMAVYKVPSRLMLVDSLPRNTMGKVVKPDVKKVFST